MARPARELAGLAADLFGAADRALGDPAQQVEAQVAGGCGVRRAQRPPRMLACVARRTALPSLVLYDLTVTCGKPRRRREGAAQGRDGPRHLRGRGRGHRHAPAPARQEPRVLLYRGPGDPRVLAPGAKGQDRRARGGRADGARWWTRPLPTPREARRAQRREARDGRRAVSLVDPELAERVIARALAHGGDLAELYAEDRARLLALAGRRAHRAAPGRHRARRLGARGPRPGQLLRPRGRPVRGGAAGRGGVGGRSRARRRARAGGAVGAPGGAGRAHGGRAARGRRRRAPGRDPARCCDETRPRRRARGRPGLRAATWTSAASSRSSTPRAWPPPTTAPACGCPPRWWPAAAIAWRPAPRRAAATPASSCWTTGPRRWPRTPPARR